MDSQVVYEGTMRSKLLQKLGYGLEQSGEVMDQQQKNIEDTAQPKDNNETEHNVVNMSTDAVAEKDFPGLGRRQMRFPARID
jgi:hypothetical protein